ncbi:glycosyltransferase family 2 protein [Rhodobacteraceae bacterium KMM 6894]|nr:glycosyltransferase family 2 protein [Rhodobacteraceae bacterium KMM 6894]
MSARASIILPAHNEAEYLGDCLSAVFDGGLAGGEVIVVANGCTDQTAAIARSFAAPDRALHVIETPTGGKPHALRLGDAAAQYGARIYLDADVIVAPGLIAALIKALSCDAPRYGSGTPVVTHADSPITRAYTRLWKGLPFMDSGAPGFGLFAMNAAGRARWGEWPDIISDDTFARLHFTPNERVQLPQTYRWPMVEGCRNLVRVRRRQDRGVAEIAKLYPALLRNEGKARVGLSGLAKRALRDPVGFGVYAAVSLAVKLPGQGGWTRGR